MKKGYSTKMIKELEKIILEKEGKIKIIVQPEIDNFISRKALLKADYLYDKNSDVYLKKL